MSDPQPSEVARVAPAVEWERLAILRELVYQWGELSVLLAPPDPATAEALRKLVEETNRVLAMEG